jgi:hypothetical protein
MFVPRSALQPTAAIRSATAARIAHHFFVQRPHGDAVAVISGRRAPGIMTAPSTPGWRQLQPATTLR